MLLKSGGSGGTGRDVMFRLVVENSAANKQTLTQFGAELAGIQKKATTTAAQEAKKRADNEIKEAKKAAAQLAKDQKKEFDSEIREAQRRDKTIADHHLKTELKLLNDLARAKKKHEEEMARYRERVRANSAQLEQRENIRLAREANRARIEAQDSTSRQYAMERRGNRSRTNAGGWTAAAGGIGSMARGVAYSGLVGEKDSQTVVNALLGVEAAKSIGTGSINAVRGASAATGMAVGAGGAVAGGGAAMAALVAWLPALASAVKAATVLIKGSSITRKGDVGGSIGEGIASTYSWMTGGMREPEGQSQFFTDPRGGKETLLNPYIQAGRSNSEVEQMTAAQAASRAAMAQQAGMIGQLGTMQRGASEGNIGASRSMLGADVARFQSMSAGDKSNDAVAAAYENVKASMEQVKRLSVEAARTQIEGSRAYLDNLRGAAQEAQQIAEKTRSAYESDISKASKLDPEGQARLREIDRKRKSGEGLTRQELEFAEGFNEFNQFTKSEQERRAEENGLSDIFSGQKEAARKADQQAITKQFEVWQSEVEVEMQHEVVVKLEGMNFADQLSEQFGDAIAGQFAQFEEKTRKTIEDKIRGAQVQAANVRSPAK
jgi:hypothetical protein